MTRIEITKLFGSSSVQMYTMLPAKLLEGKKEKEKKMHRWEICMLGKENPIKSQLLSPTS